MDGWESRETKRQRMYHAQIKKEPACFRLHRFKNLTEGHPECVPDPTLADEFLGRVEVVCVTVAWCIVSLGPQFSSWKCEVERGRSGHQECMFAWRHLRRPGRNN